MRKQFLDSTVLIGLGLSGLVAHYLALCYYLVVWPWYVPMISAGLMILGIALVFWPRGKMPWWSWLWRMLVGEYHCDMDG
ncbi:MAG: hypothetical protein PHR51_00490 [Patescibacteria group bacterium]|nr:hypothetical protein [Patescibacteria group bacterium]